MDFVRRTMLSAQVQDVVVRVEMVGQDLLLTANGDNSQRLRRSMCSFKSALAWGMERLNHVGWHCRWPHTVKSKIASRMNEIAKLPLESATGKKDAKWHPQHGHRSAAHTCSGLRSSLT
jgi:hypothetical protein